MARSGRASNCCCGVPIDFRWFDCHDIQGHVDAAVEALMTAIKLDPRRRWNPYNEAAARREFAARIKLAIRGEAVPLKHVKDLGNDPVIPLFEIRWQNEINVTEVAEDGRTRYRKVEVRLIHVEPPDLGMCAIGLHAHEKIVVAGDKKRTRELQDVEIDLAIAVHNRGYPNRWGQGL